MFLFKVLFAFIGFRLFRLPGFVLGLIIGHAFDAGVSAKWQSSQIRRIVRNRNNAEIGQMFLISTFTLLGKLVTADGQASAEELRAVEQLINDVFRLRRSDKKIALNIFARAQLSTASFHASAVEFERIYREQPWVFERMILMLLEVAVVDRDLNREEDKLIQSTAEIFGLREEQYRQLRANFVRKKADGSDQYQKKAETPKGETVRDYYSVLGCRPEDSDTTIKTRYRELVREFHPDNLAAKDLPESFTKFANEKFRDIHEAYQAVMATRT